MEIKFINIGYGNIINASRLLAIISPDSAPVKRLLNETKEKNMLVDATYGRKTRAVIIMDSGHIILTSMNPETVGHRLPGNKETKTIEPERMEEDE